MSSKPKYPQSGSEKLEIYELRVGVCPMEGINKEQGIRGGTVRL